MGLGISNVFAQDRIDFSTWLIALGEEAIGEGISQEVVATALAGVEPIPRVVELDRSQPEFTLTLGEYFSRVISKSRVERGRQLYKLNHSVLKEIGEKFGIQPRYIVALWGIESDFGRLTGGFMVVPALVTLAYDGRRSAYFRHELLNALKIVDAGHISVNRMKGSWAGAMGQSQFMPSSFLNFAYDYNGDGKKDIWNTTSDVFASTANYLARSGWRAGEKAMRRVVILKSLEDSFEGLGVLKEVNEWQSLGVRQVSGMDLPVSNMPASLLKPKRSQDELYLIYNNYRVLLKWNRSHYFALAVSHLADSIIGM